MTRRLMGTQENNSRREWMDYIVFHLALSISVNVDLSFQDSRIPPLG